jgi:hypothetical protein
MAMSSAASLSPYSTRQSGRHCPNDILQTLACAYCTDTHLDIHSSERRLYRLQHFLHYIIRAHPVQHSLDGIQRAAPLHAPLVLWRGNDDTMGVDLPGGQGNQRRRYVVNIMEGSKHTTASTFHITKDRGSTYCARMLKCRVAMAEMPPATALCSLMKTMMLWRYARTSELILTSATRFDSNLRSWNMVSTWRP